MLHNDDALRCDAYVSTLRVYATESAAAVAGEWRLLALLVDATMAVFVDLFEDGCAARRALARLLEASRSFAKLREASGSSAAYDAFD